MLPNSTQPSPSTLQITDVVINLLGESKRALLNKEQYVTLMCHRLKLALKKMPLVLTENMRHRRFIRNGTMASMKKMGEEEENQKNSSRGAGGKGDETKGEVKGTNDQEEKGSEEDKGEVKGNSVAKVDLTKDGKDSEG